MTFKNLFIDLSTRFMYSLTKFGQKGKITNSGEPAMPIYEYVCNVCGTEFDALRSMKDADTAIDCKKCQSNKTHRKLSKFFANSGGRQLAGSGHNCGGCGGGGNCSHCNN